MLKYGKLRLVCGNCLWVGELRELEDGGACPECGAAVNKFEQPRVGA